MSHYFTEARSQSTHEDSATALRRILFVVALVFGFSFSPAHAATGLDYLATQQNPDGSFGNSATSLATPVQSTAEVLRAYQALGQQAQPVYVPALGYLNNNTEANTEFLARQIVVNAKAGNDVTALVNALVTNQNTDGGFGNQAGDASSVLDTAYALEALAAANYTSGTLVSSASSYLLVHQTTAGGWGDGANDPSVFVSAQAMRSLSFYRNTYVGVSTALTNAQNFLLAQRNGTGLWSESFETALVLLAIVPNVTDLALVDGTATALASSQLADGSWSHDPYTTALALQAMSAYQTRKGGATPTLTGALSGYVVRAGATEPIAGAQVTLAERPGTSVLTNSAGYFLIPALPPGTYTVTAGKAGYSAASLVASAQGGQVTLAGTLALGVATQNGLVIGKVFDAQDLTALPGASVTLTGGAVYSVVTGADGSFNLGALAPGNYAVAIALNGYVTVNGTATVVGGQTLTINQGLVKSGGFQDTAPGTVSGTVINASTGLPIAGAVFDLGGGLSGVSNATGQFVISSVPRSNYAATLTATGYVSQAYTVAFPAGATGNLGVLALYAASSNTAPTSLTLNGLVVDGVSRAPIAGATVTLIETGATTTSGADGRFVFSGITLKGFTLSTAASGYQPSTLAVSVSAFGQAEITVALAPPGSGATTSTFTGTVRDAQSGAPIAGARVSIDNTSLSAMADANGHYILSGIGPLHFSVTTSAIGYQQAFSPVDLAAAGNYTLDPRLQPAAAAGFQVLSVTANQPQWGANATALFTTQIASLFAVSTSTLVIGEVIDAAGTTVTTLTPYAQGTTTPTSQFNFAPNETKTLTIPWGTAQVAPGRYTIVVRAVAPGSITGANPHGQVLAQNSTTVLITTTSTIDGTVTTNPPFAQSGASSPVAFNAFVRNAGNVMLGSGMYELTVYRMDTGTVLYTADATAPALAVGQNSSPSFASWVPTQAGNLGIKIVALTPGVGGTITGTLGVGNIPSGTFAVDKSAVPVGTQTVHGTIQVQPADAIALAGGGINTNLHLALPSSISFANPSTAPAGSTTTSDGGQDYFWKFASLTGTGETVAFDLNLINMQLHETRAVATRAYLELSNSVTTHTVTFPANPVWNQSGVVLTAGQQVTITASGVWSVYPGGNTGPDGSPGSTGNPDGDEWVASANKGALIGYIGNQPYSGGGWFGIGSSYTFTAPVSGELWFGINDDHVSGGAYDNGGALTATITVCPASGCAVWQVDINVPTVTAVSQVGLAVTTDQSSYQPNSTVAINATVTNIGVTTASGDQVLLAIRPAGSVANIAVLPPIAVADLASGAQLSYPASWNTGTTLAGAYLLDAQLIDSTGQLLMENVAPFTIGVPPVVVSTRITTDKTVYQAWDTVTLDARVQNVAPNAMLSPSQVSVAVTTPTGTTLFSNAQSVGQLTPGALRDLFSNFQLTDAANGVYTVSLILRDAFSHAILSTAATTFQVNRNDVQALAGQMKVQAQQIYSGDLETCTDTVTNISSENLMNVTLIHQLMDMNHGLVLAQTTEVINLPAGGAGHTYTSNINTTPLGSGGFSCVVSAQINGVTKMLAFGGFRVVPPPIRIDADLKLGTKGRLLVLLDNGRRGEDDENGHDDHSSEDHKTDKRTCEGVKQLSLSAVFDRPLSSAATVTARVSGHDGVFVDAESASLAGFPGALNLSAGSNGADLVLSRLTAQGIELILQPAGGAQKLGGEYTVEVIVQDGNTLRLTSGSIHTDCSTPLNQGQAIGSFTLSALDALPAANDANYRDGDPYGPAAAPGLKAQRAFLETLLKAKGWSYTITDTAEDFTKELRSGGYTAYAVFAEQEKLEEQVQKELREAVFRGEGLVVAGIHDARNQKLLDALGIKLIGRVPANGVDLTTSPLGVSGHIALIAGDEALRMKRVHADTAGLYTVSAPQGRSDQDDCHDQGMRYDTAASTDSAGKDHQDDDECEGHPERYLDAVTTNAYGKGQSFFAGFDLLATATRDGQGSLAATLLTKGLKHVNPAELPRTPGAVVPLTLTLTNRGIATPATATINLPAGTKVMDPGRGTVGANTLVFNVNLAVGAQPHLTFWVQLPQPSGPATFQAVITAPKLTKPAATVSYTVTVLQPESLTSIDDRLTQLINSGAPNTEALRRAENYVAKALKNFFPPLAIPDLLKATDALLGIDDPAVSDIRVAIDIWIRWAGQYAF